MTRLPSQYGAPSVLSLYSGIGGLDIACQLAGGDVRLATDICPAALARLQDTLGTHTLAGDIRELLASGRLADAWGEAQPDIMIGGPPCTAFSHAGFWLEHKRNGKDAAADGLDHYAIALEHFRPRAFLLENVPGLLFRNHRPRLERFQERARKLGYLVSTQLLDAARHGTAQARRRVFVSGTSTGSPIALDDLEWPVRRTAGWALRGLPTNPCESDEVPRGQYLGLLRAVPPGENYLVHTEERGATEPRFRYRGRYWSFLLKLHPDQPAPTVPAQRVTWNGPFHWDNRHLRVRELARLQGFPDRVPLADDPREARRQLGNAVPVPLGIAVLSAVVRAVGGSGAAPDTLAILRKESATAAEVHEYLANTLATARPVRPDIRQGTD